MSALVEAGPTARIKRRVQEVDSRPRRRREYSVYVKIDPEFDPRGRYKWHVVCNGLVYIEGRSAELLDAFNFAEQNAQMMRIREDK